MNRLSAVAVMALVCGLVAPASADLLELKWATEGYYRTRSVLLTNLAAEDRYRIAAHPETNEDIIAPEIRRTSYMTQRLRITPTVSFEKLAALHFQIDALDDILWGDNNGIASAPLFSLNASNQNFLGGPSQGSVRIPRAWLEFQVPVGIMRVGRMPSHWGLGILSNGGGSANIDKTTPIGEAPRKHIDTFFDDDFGDNHFGVTVDRVLFITKPLTVAKTLMKKKDKASNLVVGYAYDKLSEAPLLPAEPTERTFRPFGQQGFISRGRNDDANEHVVFAVYNDPDWNKVRYTDEIRLGLYGVLRQSAEGSTNPSDPDLADPTANCSGGGGSTAFVACRDTGSNVWIADVWWKFRYGPWYTEGEFVWIGGDTFGGVPFPSKNRKKKLNITGGVARFGYLTELYDGVLEIGHAGGDKDLGDGTLTQRALHPDYNVGLIMFEEVLREQTARAFMTFISDENPQGAQGLMSNGGVVNANYLNPKVRYRPGLGGMTLVGGLLLAWVDTLPVNGVTGLFTPFEGEAGRFLGTEVDLALKMQFAGRMHFSLETGYLRYGSALKARLPNADSSFTLQSRVAFVW